MKLSTTTRLALRNATRRRTRTLLTAGMVVFSAAMLLVALSWLRGVFGALLNTATSVGGHVRIVTTEFAAREELLPLYENLPDTAPLSQLLAAQPGVTTVEPRIMTGVTVTVGEEIGDVFAPVIGASERYFRERVGARDHLIDGAWFSGAEDEAIAGAKVVEQLRARLGDELILLGVTQDGSLSPIKVRLTGVVRLGGGALDQQIFVPLERARYLTDIPQGATELLAYTHDYEDASALADQLRSVPELKTLTVQAWSSREPWKSLSSTLRGVRNVIVAVIVFLTALGIWNTTMMSVLERTHEIGVLRALGLSRWGTVRMFVGEAITIALSGGTVGVLLGLYPAWWLEQHGIHVGERTAANAGTLVSETVRADLTLGTVLGALGLAMLMAAIGSLVPALRAASVQPVAAMRTGR